jgi:hypothetical protein
MKLGGLLAAFITLSMVTAAGAQRRPAPEVPRFEVDPMWPKPFPNRWILGSSTGVAVDARDHIFLVHLTDSFNPRTEIGLATNPVTGECCAPAPNVLELDATGNLLGHWGGPGAGYTWPEMATGLAVDDSGNVWIGGSGGADSRILKFSRDGKLIAQFGSPAMAAALAGRGDSTPEAAPPGRGAPARGGRRPATPPLPPNSTSMESFGGPAGFSFDA